MKESINSKIKFWSLLQYILIELTRQQKILNNLILLIQFYLIRRMFKHSISAFPGALIFSGDIIIPLLLITKQIIDNTTILNLSICTISKQVDILTKRLNIRIIARHNDSSMIIIFINLNECLNTMFTILA